MDQLKRSKTAVSFMLHFCMNKVAVISQHFFQSEKIRAQLESDLFNARAELTSTQTQKSESERKRKVAFITVRVARPPTVEECCG